MVIKKPGRTYYKKPVFPDFPKSEWESRIDKAQEIMSDSDIDCLLVWQRENVRYFYGFQTIHWYLKSLQPGVGIIPAEGEPTLVVPELFQGNVEGLCWLDDIRVQEDPHQPKVQRELPKEIAEIVKEKGYGDGNIALEKGPLGCTWIPRPLNDIETLKNSLPDANFVDGDKVIWGCRMIKSPLELERIRKSINGIKKVQAAIVEQYRPGMMEEDIQKIIDRTRAELEGNSLGHDGVSWEHFIAGTKKQSFADIKALEGATIGKNDPIQYDGAFYYKGYCPDSARVWQVGPVTEQIEEYYSIIFEGEDNVEEMLRPGVKANEVYEAMYKPIKDRNLKGLDMGGHGTGMDTHEPPSIDEWNEQKIEEGMVLSIEPWLVSDEGVLFGIQDTFVVTRNGCEKIEALNRDIKQVYHPYTY